MLLVGHGSEHPPVRLVSSSRCLERRLLHVMLDLREVHRQAPEVSCSAVGERLRVRVEHRVGDLINARLAGLVEHQRAVVAALPLAADLPGRPRRGRTGSRGCRVGERKVRSAAPGGGGNDCGGHPGGQQGERSAGTDSLAWLIWHGRTNVPGAARWRYVWSSVRSARVSTPPPIPHPSGTSSTRTIVLARARSPYRSA